MINWTSLKCRTFIQQSKSFRKQKQIKLISGIFATHKSLKALEIEGRGGAASYQ